MFDDGDDCDNHQNGEFKRKPHSKGVLSSAEKGIIRGGQRIGISNDDDELLLDNYFVKVNEVFNPDGTD
jgi:hypothetical protein